MDIIVHTGTEKTGTTTIQEFLHKNRSNLAKAGFHFLQTLELDNNRDMVAYCMRDERIDEYLLSHSVSDSEQKASFKRKFLDRFQEEVASIPPHVSTVIVSSEHFQSRLVYDDEVGSLKSLLSPYFGDIRILTYLRKQVDMGMSAYSTLLKSGYSGEFNDFMQAQCTPENYYFNHLSYLKKWERVFGKSALRIRIFDRKQFKNFRLIDDFLDGIQPSLVGRLDTDVPVRNEAINHFGQCLLNSVNRHLPRSAEGVGINPRNIRIVELISEEAKGGGITLDAVRYREVQSRFEESNEALRREYFPERRFVFDDSIPKPGELLISKENEVLLDKVIAILARQDPLVSGEAASIPPLYAEQIADLTRQLADLRTNRTLIHGQLVSALDELTAVRAHRDSLHQQLVMTNKRLAARESELARLNAMLITRIVLKLKNLLKKR